MKKPVNYVTCLLLFFFIVPASVMASDQIQPETFLHFTKVAGLEKQYDQMITIFAANFQQGMVAGLDRGLSGKDIPEDIKTKLYPMVKDSAEKFRNIFETVFKKEVRFRDLVDNVYIPVYSKHFSESELKEIIKFYNSQVGKKVAKLTPSIMQESSNTFNQVYGGKVQELGGELMNQEINKLLVKVKELTEE